jgi:hypothetical protein
VLRHRITSALSWGLLSFAVLCVARAVPSLDLEHAAESFQFSRRPRDRPPDQKPGFILPWISSPSEFLATS